MWVHCLPKSGRPKCECVPKLQDILIAVDMIYFFYHVTPGNCKALLCAFISELAATPSFLLLGLFQITRRRGKTVD